jgi:hypothetical protein
MGHARIAAWFENEERAGVWVVSEWKLNAMHH